MIGFLLSTLSRKGRITMRTQERTPGDKGDPGVGIRV